MIRVVHIITGLYRGGAETMLYKLVKNLSRDKGFVHSIIALTDGNQFDFDALNVKVQSLGMLRGLPTPAALLKLRHMIKGLNPDVVHGWMYHGNIAAAMVVPRGVPVVWGIHHSLSDLAQERILTKALIRLGPIFSGRVNRIQYCAQVSQHQHEIIGYSRYKSIFIPNGFDCENFYPVEKAANLLRHQLHLPNEARLVGHAARFHLVKNHEGLIAAFGVVGQTHLNAWLLLAGSGVTSANPIIMQSVAKLPIDCRRRVLLLGERDDMPLFYAALDVSVLASHSEGFPNVLGEAMACSTPCITTDVGDSAVIVGDTGRVVPSRNEAALASAINEMLSMRSEDLRDLGRLARARILSEYSLPSVVQRYSILYRDLVVSPRVTSKVRW